MIDNERRGLPSASSLERLYLCPRSYAMEQGLPDTTSAIAEEGTLLHAVMAGEASYDNLTPDQQVQIDKARAIEEKLVLDCFGGSPLEVIQEERLWYKNYHSKEREPLFSGRFDRIYIERKCSMALVIDWKFGFIPVASAAANTQLRAYALLVHDTYGVKHVFVAAIQPRCASPLELCEYRMRDLAKAEDELLKAIEATKRPDAPRIPSEVACKYCKAKTFCKEAHAQVESLVPLQTIDLDKRIGQLPGKDLARFLEIAENAETVIEAVRAEAKERLAKDPASVPGYVLKPGNARREITDNVRAYELLKPAGVTASEFMGMCTVSIGAMEKAYGSKHGLKGKELKDAFSAAIAPILNIKQNAPSLAKQA